MGCVRGRERSDRGRERGWGEDARGDRGIGGGRETTRERERGGDGVVERGWRERESREVRVRARGDARAF